MSIIKKITGTFLDEITWDIGSQNWGEAEWRRDFEAMACIGIDTVIIIRGGLRDQAVFPSQVVGNDGDPDLAAIFLDAAQQHGMKLFFGTYDTGNFDLSNATVDKELDLNLRFVEEVLERYGDHPAFRGWYLSHEISNYHAGVNTLYATLAKRLKDYTPELPVMISPFYPTETILGNDYLTPAQFAASWRKLLEEMDAPIDIAAFQDGVCLNHEFADYLAEAKKFCDEFEIALWNNVETFDRNLSYHFPPRDIRLLRRRIETAAAYVEKQITFEFSHFMSPNSSFPGAPNLYRRYCEQVLGVNSPY